MNKHTTETIKYESEQVIIEFTVESAENIMNKYKDILDLFDNMRLSLYKNYSSQNLMKLVILSLILSSLGSNAIYPDGESEFIKKLQNIAQTFDIEYNDILNLSQHESILLKIIKSEN